MTWTYDNTDLDKTTSTGQINVVRLLVGDTTLATPLIQDEEINFFLAENNADTYGAAISAAEQIAGSYAREVNREVGDLAIEAETKMQHFISLADRLRKVSRKYSPRAGIFIGNDPKQRLFAVGMHDETGGGEYRTLYDKEEGLR
jgi:hypothetical protein